MAAVSASEISDNAKLAREMALIGNYDSAGIYYEGVLQMVQQLVLGLADPVRKGKWTLVRYEAASNYKTSSTLSALSYLADSAATVQGVQ